MREDGEVEPARTPVRELPTRNCRRQVVTGQTTPRTTLINGTTRTELHFFPGKPLVLVKDLEGRQRSYQGKPHLIP